MAQSDEILTYFRPDTGAGLLLNDETNYRLLHHDGFGIGDMTHISSPVPELDGEYWIGAKFNTKVITLELAMYGPTIAGLQAKRAQLIDYLNPKLVDPRSGRFGRLRLQQTDGRQLQMDCVLSEAMSLPTSEYIGTGRAARLQLRFRSVGAPYLYDPNSASIEYALGGSGGFRVDPFRLPMRVSASEIFRQVTLVNAGHVESPVLIDVLGPATAIALTNTTLNRSVEFRNENAPLVLSAGQHLVVNTDPFNLTVTLDGANAWNYLSRAEFWLLTVGDNDLIFDLGSANANTRVTVSYNTRYLGM